MSDERKISILYWVCWIMMIVLITATILSFNIKTPIEKCRVHLLTFLRIFLALMSFGFGAFLRLFVYKLYKETNSAWKYNPIVQPRSQSESRGKNAPFYLWIIWLLITGKNILEEK